MKTQEDRVLTGTEMAIVDLVAEGLSTEEIAKELKLRPGTVRTTLTSIYAKLKLRDKTQLALWAHGLYPPQR